MTNPPPPMTIDDLQRVFAVIAGFVSRKFGKSDYLLWAPALAGHNPDECIRAVQAHYSDPATCTQYLVPGLVIGRVQQLRRTNGHDEHSARVFGEIEARKEAFDPDAHHRGAAACRAAFDQAITAKHAREAAEADADHDDEQAAS